MPDTLCNQRLFRSAGRHFCRWFLVPLVIMATVATTNGESEPDFGVTTPGIAVAGQKAPDFLLLDLEEKPVSLSEFRGKPVVLNFFASWCSPCLKELPIIQEAHVKAGNQGFVVLGVGYQDSRWAIEELADEFGLTFTIVIDGDNSVGQIYRVIGPPYTFFIDADGIVIDVVSGAMSPDILRHNLEKLLSTGRNDAV